MAKSLGIRKRFKETRTTKRMKGQVGRSEENVRKTAFIKSCQNQNYQELSEDDPWHVKIYYT